MTIKAKNITPFILIFLFVMPPSIVFLIPLDMRFTYYYFIVGCYWIVSLLFFKPIFLSKDNSFATPFTLILLLSGLITFLVKQDTSLFNIIFPISAFFAYKICIYQKTEFKTLFNLYFLFLYLLFYIHYYSIIPDLFYRPEFNEDMMQGASSNAIPWALNNSLFIYMVLNFLYKWGAERSLLTIASINLLLNFIQQGRGGIIMGILLLFIALYEYSPKTIYRIRYIYISTLLLVLYFTIQGMIEVFVLSTWDFASVDEYSVLKERRVLALLSFLNQISISNFFFGFADPWSTTAAQTWFDDELYAFNTFLDFWNRYNFFALCTLIFFLIYRFYNRNQFLLPIYYVIFFIIYGMIESIYLPSFRDCFIYLILFLPKHHQYAHT